jgi:hypothetical protein
MSNLDPERIVLQAASTEPDNRMVYALMSQMLRIVHAGEFDIHLDSSESAFGWNFYMVSIKKAIVQSLAQLPESDVLKIKGDSLDQKFVNWLNKQTKKKKIDDKIKFSLLSDLRSSRYGLF